MERLTEKIGESVIFPQELVGVTLCPDNEIIDKILKRLAAYEDTGLEPEEVEHLKLASMGKAIAEIKEFNGVSIDHLCKLVEADKDGRCVVLPCKVGRSLWVHDKDGKPREMELSPPDIRCHCRDEDNLCMALCGAKKTGVCAYRLRNDGTDIGKTVFLTREAAEAALERRKNK